MSKVTTAATFAVQIRALMGDKIAAVIVRNEFVRAAILTAVKGNATPWLDGMAEAAKGKGAVAGALMAGFHAVGMIAVFIKPQEAVSAEDRAERNSAEADRLAAIFADAYSAAMPAEPTEAEKQAKKAEKEVAQAVALQKAVDEEVKKLGLIDPVTHVATTGDVIRAMLAIVKDGKVGDTELDDLRAALGMEAIKTQAYNDGMVTGLAKAADDATALALSKAATPTVSLEKAPAKKASRKPATV